MNAARVYRCCMRPIPPAASAATVTGSGTNSVQVTGTVAVVNTALNGITYTAPNTTAAILVTMATAKISEKAMI